MPWHERDYYREEQPRFGGGGGTGWPFNRLGGSSVTTWLIVINAVVFLIDSVLFGSQRASAIAPSHWGSFNWSQGIAGGQLWRLVTYQFLHRGFWHILWNMVGLFFFGPMMEQWWASKRYLVFYLACGIAGAFAFVLLMPVLPGVRAQTGLVGASACVTGVVIGAAVVYPKQRVMLILPPIPMPLWVMAVGFVVLNLLSVGVGAHNAGGAAAHLGGAALGAVLVKVPQTLDWADRFSASAIQRGATRGRFERKQRQERAHEEDLDRVLGKVKEHGLHSLNRREKKILRQATDERRGK